MKYRIKINITEDGSRIYTPQYKEFFFWENFLMGTMCDDTITFPNEDLAKEYIDLAIKVKSQQVPVRVMYKEYPF